MAKYSADEAAAVLAIQQVINEWGDELDQNSGRKMTEAKVLTDDVRYFVGGEWREGIAAVQAFYDQRWDTLTAGDGAPVMRHVHSNYRAQFFEELSHGLEQAIGVRAVYHRILTERGPSPAAVVER